MKWSTKKRMIALMLCMVLVISNSISILADVPEAETASVEQAAEKTTEKAKEEATEAKKETKASEKKEETTTEAKKEEKASEEKKEDQTEEAKKEETTSEEKKEEATTEAKKEEKASTEEEKTTSEEKQETTTENKEEQKAVEAVTTEAKAEETTTEAAKEDTTEETLAEEKSEVVSPMELVYENNDIKVVVKATEENVIPEGTTLKVTPIAAGSDQYNEIGEKISETIIKDDDVLESYIAYDISLVTEDGEEKEPNGKVTVTMDYKEATAPDGIVENAQNSSDKQTVSLIHFEEKETNVQVVDLTEKNQAQIKTTENQELKKVEFTTDSFSTYSITWSGSNSRKIIFHYVDGNADDIYNAEEDSSIQYDSSNDSYIPLAIKHIDGYKYSSNYIMINNNKKENIAGLYYSETNEGGGNHGGGIKYYNISYLDNTSALSKTQINADRTSWNSTLDVYLVYEKESNSETGSDDTTIQKLGAPEHNKYIEKNGDGTYSLTLDVTGKRSESKQGVDLLFVLDFSGSMDGELEQSLKTQVQTISEMFLPEGNTDNKVAAVSFSSGTYSGNNNTLSWKTSSSTVVSTVCGTRNNNGNWSGGWRANGGTNWQNGMILAENMLASAANDGNKKYVIFISDGKPTKRYQSYTQIANTRGSEIGHGSSDDGRNFDAAVAQFELSTNLRKSTVYAVYLTDSAASSMNKFGKAIGAVGGALDGTGTNFNSTMQGIANQIMYGTYKDVSISDTLSQYVDFATDSNGNISWSVLKNGESLDSSKYELTGPTKENPKSFTLKIKEELDQDAVYSISCTIKPNEEAEYEYSNNGYYETGETKTDLENIIYDKWTHPSDSTVTSEGHKGFRANTEAKLTYTQKYGTSFGSPETNSYAHPVVQVETDTTTHTVNKVWTDTSKTLESINVSLVPQIKDGDTTTYRNLTSDEIGAYAAFNDKLTYELTSDNNWTHTFTDLPKYYYTKNDQGEIKKLEIKYTAVENLSDEDAEKYKVEVEDSSNGKTTTITNTPYPDVTISKIWSDFNNKYKTRPDSVTLQLQRKLKDTQDAKWDDYKDPIVLYGNNFEGNVWSVTVEYLPTGYDYRLVEKNVPNYYNSSSCREDSNGNLSITNSLNWNLVKVSSSSDDPIIKLEGAEFELTDKDKDGNTYTGTSAPDGVVTWKSGENNNNITIIPDGTYTLKETKAPAGYQLGSEVTITIENGLPTITESGSEVEVETLKASWDDSSKTMNVYYADDVLYELPSAGGPGIYWYLIGGVLLMMAATLILYRNKNLRRC